MTAGHLGLTQLPTYCHWWQLPIVFLASAIGETFGVVVGSGSVIIQFALISMGMPLPSVVANDVAGAIGTNLGVMAASRGAMWRSRALIAALAIPLTLGGAAGTLFLVHIPSALLRYIVIGALGGVLLYTVLSNRSSARPLEMLRPTIGQHLVLFPVMLVLGVYATSISLGEGTLGKLAIIGILGIGFADSLVISSVAILPARIFALAVAAVSGLIAWPILLSLWAGSFLAGRTVARHIRKVPDRYPRLVVIVATAGYLLYLVLE